MVAFFEKHTSLQFVSGSWIADIQGDLPGAGTGGRSVGPKPFNARKLRKDLRPLVRSQLYETSFLGMGIMTTSAPLPMDRVHLLNPGQTITLGDRTLTAVKPPVFDNPSTTGFRDEKSGAFFSSDCFGALLQAVPERADDLSDDELRQGQVLWATIDSPWVHKVDPAALAKELNQVREMNPTMVLSSHLPAASGAMTEQLLDSLGATPTAQPFIGPDQAALEQMLAQMTAGAPQ